MTERYKIPAGTLLENWSQRQWDDGVQIDEMDDLTCLAVQTRNCLYEITILSGRSGEVLVRGGRFFRDFTQVLLSGASLGSSFLKMRGIYLGLCMEIYVDGERLITSPVESIHIASQGNERAAAN
jgi:hypothetical protein